MIFYCVLRAYAVLQLWIIYKNIASLYSRIYILELYEKQKKVVGSVFSLLLALKYSSKFRLLLNFQSIRSLKFLFYIYVGRKGIYADYMEIQLARTLVFVRQ